MVSGPRCDDLSQALDTTYIMSGIPENQAPKLESGKMNPLTTSDELFFSQSGLDQHRVERLTEDALKGADDGEMYLEYSQSEALSFDDGKLKSASFDTSQGFGLRAISGESAGYAHASELSEEAMKRAAATVKAVHGGRAGMLAEAPAGTNRRLYGEDNPLG